MDEVTARIERVTEDLRVIQRELNLAAMETPADPEEEAVSVDALETLKSALDQMRHFLWFYSQVVNQESNLREKLRQALGQGEDEPAETASAIDRLARTANRAFFRYRLNGKKPN
ncbi:MAG TPA: hypothetical protein VFU27_14510 [Terriglobales bacterium]|nr:hypothetical protein [Terriglobales bacterium]